MHQDKLLKIDEAAEKMGYPKHKVYQLIEDGKLPALSIGTNGKGLRIRESKVDQFLNQCPKQIES